MPPRSKKEEPGSRHLLSSKTWSRSLPTGLVSVSKAHT